MSALTDLFSAMANKIRSKTGTQTTYTPSEMVSDGIDDVFDAGVASVPTPTSIMPSNASPVALTANTPVKPTTSGYAIASYSSKTPSDSNPPSIYSAAIIKASSSGYLTKNPHPLLGSAPDKSYTNASMANNATASITVTQKPRYIVMSVSSTTNAGTFQVGLYDVENNTAYRYGYWSNAWQNGTWSTRSDYITSVSSSSVGIKNSWGGTARIAVGCYY